MIEPEHGFAINDVPYRWGTLPGDIAGTGRLPSAASYIHRDVRCRSIFGLAGAGVMISAPAADRPVMTATYEFAAPWLRRANPDRWLDAMRTRFGAPTSEGNHDLRGYRDPGSGVAFWARWHRPTIDISVSIYGGIRVVKFGRSAGLISLGWSDTIAAASPFVAAWHAASAALGESARSMQAFQRFTMPEPLQPAAGATESDSGDLFAARRALHNRALLATPQQIRDQLDRQAFALWQSAVDGRWALSSVWDTVLLRNARIGWYEIKPAKGGGYSRLSMGGWLVMMPYGTAAIAAAAAALKALPGVVVEAHEGYDT
jgi:hypothetical protein